MTQTRVIFAASYKSCPACYYRSPNTWPVPPAEPCAGLPAPFGPSRSLTMSASRYCSNAPHTDSEESIAPRPIQCWRKRCPATCLHPTGAVPMPCHSSSRPFFSGINIKEAFRNSIHVDGLFQDVFFLMRRARKKAIQSMIWLVFLVIDSC